ncbi:MAG: ATP-binding protein [bacterium]
MDAITPVQGPTAGGTSVTVHGVRLEEVTAVTFGTQPAEFRLDEAGQLLVVAPPRPLAGLVALSVQGPHGSDSAWFTYEDPQVEERAVPDKVPNKLLPCTAAILPTAPGERIVVPFPASCGLESVVVRLPNATGSLELSISPVYGLPAGAPPPGMITAPTSIFEATLRDATGAEVEPDSALLQVRVPGSWMAACSPPACRPVLFHYHDNAWTQQNLTVVDDTNGTLVMQAEVGSFSLFAVAGVQVAVPGPWYGPWIMPLAGLAVLSAPTAVVVTRRRHRKAAARIAAVTEADSEARVADLMDEMRNKEELLQFVNNAAHDLANPLTPIQLQLDLLADASKERPEEADALQVVRSNVTQLEALVKDLRDAAKLQSGKLRLTPAPLDLGALVRSAVQSYAIQAASAQVQLSASGPDAVEVHADQANVRRVLTNFLNNALKFTPSGGRIDVRLSVDEQEAFVEVVDTGLGLTEEDRMRLFRPFSQVHGEAEKAKGTGLGLYISKGIIEGHGGRIGCTSDGPGTGSTFWFTLPIHASATAVPTAEKGNLDAVEPSNEPPLAGIDIVDETGPDMPPDPSKPS